MLCCITEIAMLVLGIIALVTGKFTLSRNRVVKGMPARIVGVVLLLPLGLALLFWMILRAGMVVGALQKGQQEFDPRPLVQLPWTLRIIEVSLIVVCFATAVGIAWATGQPAVPKRQVEREADEFMGRFDDPDENDLTPRRPPDERFRAE